MDSPPHPPTQLRVNAEAELAGAAPNNSSTRSAADLLHDLQVHQIELEMQNESLRQAQVALEESRDRYADLYEFAPVGYLVLNDAGLVAALNLTAATLLGEERGKLLQRRFSRLVDEADQDAWHGYFRRALRQGRQHSCELTLRRGDGTSFDARIDCQVATGNHQIAGLRITLTDVTARKQAMATLQASENRYASLFRNMFDGLAHCRMIFREEQPVDYEFIAVNPAFEKMTGMQDVAGRRVSDLFPGYAEGNQVSLETFGRVARSGEPTRWTHYFAPLDKWLSFAVYQPNADEFIAIIEDISERKCAEDAIRASEDRLRLANTAAQIGVYDRDIASGKIEWNEHARELWGVEPNDPITYATFMAGVHPDDRADTQAAIARALDPRGAGEFKAEYRVINRADGSVRNVEARGRALFSGRRAVRMVGTLKDVSAQKQLGREMQERRSEMDLLIQQQVAAHTAVAIAHELNQPLVAISAYSEAALRMLHRGASDPEKLARALEGAAAQSQRAGRTLHELLDFLHKGEAISAPVDLAGVVLEAFAIAEEGGYGGFRPEIEMERDLRPVLGNRLQLQKVLLNLLHNSVEAMRGAGVPKAGITITARSMPGKEMALVTVRDSGPGLDAEMASRVFEPFFTTKSTGVGLGLAISRALVEAHGGRLWADPDAGSGAKFHLTLPFAQ